MGERGSLRYQAASSIGASAAVWSAPQIARVIDRMRTLRNDGLGFDRVAAQLNDEGFLTRKGTAWHGFSVSRILGRAEQE